MVEAASVFRETTQSSAHRISCRICWSEKSIRASVLLYNASDVVVMPSHYESFGMVALEAMACGVPVIMTNVSGITGILDETYIACHFSAKSTTLASQIESLLLIRKSEKRSVRNFGQMSDLSWSKTVERILETYSSIIS